MEEDSEDRDSDERDEEETAARPPVSATLTGVVLGELGWDWANFLWAWSRGLGRSRGSESYQHNQRRRKTFQKNNRGKRSLY